MTESTGQLKERFEAWICREAPSYSLVPADPDCGTYKELDTEALWKAWQESAREASADLRDRFEQVCRDLDLDLQREGEGYRSRITEEHWQIVRGCAEQPDLHIAIDHAVGKDYNGYFCTTCGPSAKPCEHFTRLSEAGCARETVNPPAKEIK